MILTTALLIVAHEHGLLLAKVGLAGVAAAAVAVGAAITKNIGGY